MLSRSRNLSPDTLTERWLKGLGWTVDQCQRQTGPLKRDLFGFADQFAFTGNLHLLVQTTSTSNLASRRRKVLDSDNAMKWKMATEENLIWLIGWRHAVTHVVMVLEEVQLQPGKLVSVRVEDAATFADVRGPYDSRPRA